jgi:hypothetical protein
LSPSVSPSISPSPSPAADIGIFADLGAILYQIK